MGYQRQGAGGNVRSLGGGNDRGFVRSILMCVCLTRYSKKDEVKKAESNTPVEENGYRVR